MITVKQLRDHLATLPDDLPIVFTHDSWQHYLRIEEMPRLAMWTRNEVGTPKTQKAIEDDRRLLGDDECADYIHPCVVIGWIE